MLNSNHSLPERHHRGLWVGPMLAFPSLVGAGHAVMSTVVKNSDFLDGGSKKSGRGPSLGQAGGAVDSPALNPFLPCLCPQEV